MQTHIQELVLLHSKLTKRYPKELVDQFVDRLTFCFFIGDMGLFPGIPEFRNWLRKSEHFSTRIKEAFESLPFYKESKDVILDIKEIDQVRKLCDLDWRDLSPFIFGRIFELTLETEDRSRLGAHYTPEEDIRDLIEPVILSGLRSELEKYRNMLNIGTSDPDLYGRLMNGIRSVKVLDPACGTGNFLLICLWSLLDLENEVIKLSGGFYGSIPSVTERQLYGIEKDPRAFWLMRIVLWLGYIQWMRKNFDFNVQIDPFSIPNSGNFLNCDAILDLGDVALPKERVWPEVDYIVGNPPYLGASKMRQLFGDEYCDILSWVFSDRVPGSADFGAYWIEKSRDMIDREQVKAAGFVISTAIKQEWSRPVLDRVNQSGKIFFAISDRIWESNEAAVHVSLIGFTGMRYYGDKILDGEVVPVIYSNLSSRHNASGLKQIKSGSFDCISGTGDALENSIEEQEAIVSIGSLSLNTLNTLRPFVGGRDMVQGSSNRWTICNLDDPVGTGRVFSGKRYLVTPRVSKYCVFLWLDSVFLPDSGIVVWDIDDGYVMGIMQSKVHRAWTLVNCGWRGETRNYQIRSCFRSFVFPSVDDGLEEEIRRSAEKLNRLRNDWLYPERLIRREHLKFCSTVDGPWRHYSVGEFGCGLIKVDYPLIRPINTVAEKILSKRTVTALYNDNPRWLQEAHKELDVLVLKAYGWDIDVSDDEIVSGLKLLNERTTGGSGFAFSL